MLGEPNHSDLGFRGGSEVGKNIFILIPTNHRLGLPDVVSLSSMRLGILQNIDYLTESEFDQSKIKRQVSVQQIVARYSNKAAEL